MKNLIKKLTTRDYRGDTIVEVMISMAILAVVVGAAYVSATKSFDASLNSQYRDQGVSYAQQQLELIKEADNRPVPTISSYEISPGTPFCITPTGPTQGSRVTVSSGNCKLSNGYNVAITYCDNTSPCTTGQAPNSFKVTTSWASATSQTQQSTLFYKPNDSFGGTTRACTPSMTASCTSTLTNPPTVHVIANPDHIYSGDTTQISWSTISIKPGSCQASGGAGGWPNGPVADNNSTGITTSPLPAGDYTFTVTCNDNAGDPVPGFATVEVQDPTPLVTLTATPHQLGLRFSAAGQIAGMTCISLNETADPDTWNDNYLCWPTNENLNLNWVTAGPTNAGVTTIGGQTCVNTFEGSDPDTWWDNYLCGPKNYGFRWSSSGPIAGMSCGSAWNETADPHTWNDNYLCEPVNSTIDLSWSSTKATSCSNSWGGAGSGTSGSDTVYGLIYGINSNPSTTFKVTCSNAVASGSDSKTIFPGGVAAQPACAGSYCSAPIPSPVINSFYYTPKPPVDSATIYLYWSSSNTSYCNVNGWGGYINLYNQPTSYNGFYGPNYHPLNSYSLTLTCFNSSGASASASVSPPR